MLSSWVADFWPGWQNHEPNTAFIELAFALNTAQGLWPLVQRKFVELLTAVSEHSHIAAISSSTKELARQNEIARCSIDRFNARIKRLGEESGFAYRWLSGALALLAALYLYLDFSSPFVLLLPFGGVPVALVYFFVGVSLRGVLAVKLKSQEAMLKEFENDQKASAAKLAEEVGRNISNGKWGVGSYLLIFGTICVVGWSVLWFIKG